MRISDWSSDVCSSDLHIARGFQHQNEEEQNKDLRQEDDHRAHTVDDAVNQEVSHDPFRHLLRHKGSDAYKTAFNIPYGCFGPGIDCLTPYDTPHGTNDCPGDRMQSVHFNNVRNKYSR